MNHLNEVKTHEFNEKLKEICRRFYIKQINLFGSILRDDFNKKSDIDLLVDFDSNHIPSIFQIIDIEEEISKLFNGHKVDVRTKYNLSRYFRDDVISHSEILFNEI